MKSLPHPGERLLATGLGLLVFCAALAHFVMIGLLGVAGLPLALLPLFIGSLRVADSAVPAGRRRGGVVLLMLGLLLLAFVAVMAAGLASELLRHATVRRLPRPPGYMDWVNFFGGSWCAALLVCGALTLATRWPLLRRLTWSFVVLAVPLAAMLLFRLLAIWLPIDA